MVPGVQYPQQRNCRERVVTVVRVVFATKWQHEEVLFQHAGNSLRQLQQCRRDRLEFYRRQLRSAKNVS